MVSVIKKSVLTFEKVPEGLGLSKKVIFGIIDVSGIQKYIFGRMDKRSTVEDIRGRSVYVEKLTYEIGKRLKDRFGKRYLFQTVSSGKIQCALSPAVSVAKLQSFCDELQRAVFATTEGKLTFHYSFCKAYCINSKAFDESRMIPVQSTCAKELERQKYNCKNLLLTDMEKEYTPAFSEKSLASADSHPLTEDCEALAAVKLDLDNLGLFFRDVTEFDKRDKVSRTLNDTILHCIEEDRRLRLIFAGGDDIFFICKADEYLSSTVDFYLRLRKSIGESPLLSDYNKKGVFGISAGVCRILSEYGAVPLLIYSEKAEERLHYAKTVGQKNCVCVEDCIIGWEDLALVCRVYLNIKDELYKNSDGDLSLLFDVQLLKERILKFAKFNKNALTKEEDRAIESIKILLL